jgi:hypothetical protein
VGGGGEVIGYEKCDASAAIDFGVSLIAMEFGKADWFCGVSFGDCNY